MNFNNLLVLFCVLSVVTLVYTAPPATTPAPKHPDCKAFNSSCEECVKHPQCIYCYAGNRSCMDYPVSHIIPRVGDCDLGLSRWGTCVLNYKALLIAMGTIAGLLLLSCTGCVVYCCWCRGPSGRQRRKWLREDQREETRKAERQMRQDQRKAERAARNDEIRRKYGLKRDDDGQYHELEEEA